MLIGSSYMELSTGMYWHGSQTLLIHVPFTTTLEIYVECSRLQPLLWIIQNLLLRFWLPLSPTLPDLCTLHPWPHKVMGPPGQHPLDTGQDGHLSLQEEEAGWGWGALQLWGLFIVPCLLTSPGGVPLGSVHFPWMPLKSSGCFLGFSALFPQIFNL